MGYDFCPDCESPLIITEDLLANGDEVPLVFCDSCGYYGVYSYASDSVVTEKDHTCGETLEEYLHKRDNGDRIDFSFCSDCGFYTAGEKLAKE